MYKIIGGDGQTYGPISPEQLRRWIAEGRAASQTMVQAEGAQDWKPLSQFPEFASDLKITPTPPVVAPSPYGLPPNPLLASKASNKLAAGICGILLGGFGIHKFILGYTSAGLVMLLISVLSCGIGYPVMHIIGLVEGIVYLTKSDEEFVRIYVDGQKAWF